MRVILLLIFFGLVAVADDVCPDEESRAPLGPIIEVRGNGYIIANGDSDPANYDLTDFGQENIGDSSDTHYYVIHNIGDEDLILSGPPYVVITGDDDDEFEVVTYPDQTIAPDDSTLFGIRFEPDTFGLREATVVIESNDADNSPYTFDIEGGVATTDDDNIYWYASCGAGAPTGFSWYFPLLVLACLLLIRRSAGMKKAST